jgi:endonuclease YncB( thermonuclease family)
MTQVPIQMLQKMLRGKNPATVVVMLILMAVVFYLSPEGKKSDPQDATRGWYEGTCIKVLDGDTIDVRADSGEEFRLRLLGIDCMETYNENKMAEQADRLGRSMNEIRRLGERARNRTRDLVSGQPVRWEVPEGTPLFDPYDRMLAYVERDGRDVGEVLLREGLAELRRDRHPRAERYRSEAKPLAR